MFDRGKTENSHFLRGSGVIYYVNLSIIQNF